MENQGVENVPKHRPTVQRQHCQYKQVQNQRQHAQDGTDPVYNQIQLQTGHGHRVGEVSQGTVVENVTCILAAAAAAVIFGR